jgi:Cu(I)/Ag(I) efflux system protein CusF
MRNLTLLTLLAVPLSLTACDNANDADMPMENEEMPIALEDMPMGADAMSMDGENMPTIQSGAARTASAEGTVTAIDAEAGTITLDHGPVPAMDWPAMTMAFDAAPEVRSQVAVGDAVTFEFEASDAGNRIASISKK